MRMDDHIKHLIEKYTLEASILSGKEKLEKYRMAYAQAKELRNAFTIRACAANLGAMYISLGTKKDAEEGLKILEEANPPEGVSDCVSNGDLFFNRGLGYEVLGHLERAYMNMEKAWKEYCSERDNLVMVTKTLRKLLQLSMARQKLEDAVKWCQKLEDSYAQTSQPVEQFKVALQRMCFQEKLGVEDLPKLWEECQLQLEEIQHKSLHTVDILVEMSVLLASQKQPPKIAKQYLQKADSLLGVEDSKSLEKAMVLQNLGAMCNFLGDWKSAASYHSKAISIYQHYASLPPDADSPIQPLIAMRCQCHCTANHAYTMIREDDVDEASKLFYKALELARQCGDTYTVWQMEEALGAVNYRLAFLDSKLPSNPGANIELSKSRMRYLDKSLEWFKKALEHSATDPKGSAQDQDRILAKFCMVKNLKTNATLVPPGQMGRTLTSWQRAGQTLQRKEGTASSEAHKLQAVKAVDVQAIPRVAGTNEESEIITEFYESDISSDKLGSEFTDDDEGKAIEGDHMGRSLHLPAEEDEEREQMKELYQEQLQGTMPKGEQQHTIKVDVHRHVSSSAESDSSEEDEDEEEEETSESSEEEEEEETEEGEEEQKKRRDPQQPPPPPAQSPPATLLPSGTYETPQSPTAMEINELYGSHQSRPRPGLHSSTNYAELEFEDNKQQQQQQKKGASGPSQSRRDDPDYETMELSPTSPSARPTRRSQQSEESVDFEMGGNSLSHGDTKEKKDSKTCAVM